MVAAASAIKVLLQGFLMGIDVAQCLASGSDIGLSTFIMSSSVWAMCGLVVWYARHAQAAAV